MITSFRDSWLKSYFIDDVGSKKIPANLDDRLFRKLQLVDDAENDPDLRVPPGNHFEKLSANLKGRHSIRINRQWRLIFEWNESEGKASDIYLDKHEYR